MMTTKDLLESVKLLKVVHSDYALAKLLGTSRQTISNYQTGRYVMDVEMCFRVAELLGFDPAQVVAWIEAERAHRAERAVDEARWAERAKKLAGMAAAVLVAFGLGSPSPAEASETPSAGRATVHYVYRRRSRKTSLQAVAASAVALLSGRWTRAV